MTINVVADGIKSCETFSAMSKGSEGNAPLKVDPIIRDHYKKVCDEVVDRSMVKTTTALLKWFCAQDPRLQKVIGTGNDPMLMPYFALLMLQFADELAEKAGIAPKTTINDVSIHKLAGTMPRLGHANDSSTPPKPPAPPIPEDPPPKPKGRSK